MVIWAKKNKEAPRRTSLGVALGMTSLVINLDIAMKIAISTDGTDLEAEVAQRFGTSQYLLIVDLETMSFDTVPNPGATGQRGAGMQAVVLAISKDVKAVLTGYCSPAATRQLTKNGIQVYAGLSGKVKDVINKYKTGDLEESAVAGVGSSTGGARIDRVAFSHALTSSARQLAMMLPILISVVLLIGLFNAFVPKDFLLSIFSGNPILDTLVGACFGSIFAGNAINSYVIGGELLGYGVTLFAVTALIIAWVSVGVIQLPAEIAALGGKFALIRNGLSFVMAIGIAILTVAALNLILR